MKEIPPGYAARRADGTGYQCVCQICGTMLVLARLSPARHEAGRHHVLHEILNRRARDGWAPVAMSLRTAVGRLGHAVEGEGEHVSMEGRFDNQFARLDALRDVVLTMSPKLVTRRWAAIAIAATERAQRLGEPWHRAWDTTYTAAARAGAADDVIAVAWWTR